jgi:hypothetical protein
MPAGTVSALTLDPDVQRLGQVDRTADDRAARVLRPRLALAGEDRLGHGAAPAHDRGVGGDRFAGPHQQHVARTQRRRGNALGRQGPGKAREPLGECRGQPREMGERAGGAVSCLELEVPAPRSRNTNIAIES